MNCKEIVENTNYSTELLKQVKAQSTRYFILLVMISIVCMMLVAYIFYDRKKDSEVESTTTETTTTTTEVTQDGQGYNSYVDGIGDITIGAEDKKDNENGQNNKE